MSKRKPILIRERIQTMNVKRWGLIMGALASTGLVFNFFIIPFVEYRITPGIETKIVAQVRAELATQGVIASLTKIEDATRQQAIKFDQFSSRFDDLSQQVTILRTKLETKGVISR